LIRKQVEGGLLTAAEGEALQTLARNIQAIPAFRDAFGGPRERVGILPPGASHSYRIAQVLGERLEDLARVWVLGEGNFEVIVTGNRGAVRGAAAGPSPGVSWHPIGEVVTVRVTNLGPREAVYRLLCT
jgi:hypothetical protein